MAERIVVTSVGIISALGKGRDAHMDAMRHSRSGLRHAQYLQSRHADDFLVGEVPKSDEELADSLHICASDNGYTRTDLLSICGVGDLLENTDKTILYKDSLALINANTVGGMGTVEKKYMNLISAETLPENIKYIDTLDCAASTQYIADYFKLKPFMATVSTACSSSANAILLGARMIRQGVVRRAICGGSDSLSRFTLNGFNTLKNISRGTCRPFDQNRDGLNLGEAAGYLLLEKETDAKARGAEIIAILSGYCNSNDAYHPTAPSPNGDGAYNTMKGALAIAGLQPGEIGYINAHGTATVNNDLAEGIAIQRLFGDIPPPFSSTKPFTGHTLAAAGAIEVIFSMLAMQHNSALPNLNFATRMEELAIAPSIRFTDNIQMQHVLTNSFGFGGNNVCLVFSKS